MPEPAQIMVCFQLVTNDGSVIDTEPEPFEDIKAATIAADTWLKMKGQTLQIITYEGFGVSVKTDSINHITAMPVEKMAEEFARNKKLAEEIYSGPIASPAAE